MALNPAKWKSPFNKSARGHCNVDKTTRNAGQERVGHPCKSPFKMAGIEGESVSD